VPSEETETPGDDRRALVRAIEREAVPVDLAAPAGNLDTVAADLAESSVVGIGENSHGVAEFKTASTQLIRRLVADHGYRLVAMEGTLGDFAPVNDYVTRGEGDLDEAMAELEFYFWRTDGVRRLFEWLREFNEGRPESDRAVVYGYDAQFFDVNATALRSSLQRVDPDYLRSVEDTLDPLTTPLYRRNDASFLTDARRTLIENLRSHLQDNRPEYVAATSESEWELLVRHVWTLERGLQYFETVHTEGFAQGKAIRDEAMADTVAWLRDWTGADRAIVLGNSNHTMGGASAEDTGTRMGQHLSDRLGDDYYSLGLLFGTGSFTAPSEQGDANFETYALDGPVDDTAAATLTDVSHPQFVLDFETARDRAAVDAWLDTVSNVQFSVPRAPRRGAVPLPSGPETVYDGVCFVRDVAPAAFD
jgi:erythromycin esterase